MNATANTTRAGFTLIEMLVVISITTIVLVLSFPMIGAMRRDTSASSGVNTITVAIPSARRYATADLTLPTDLDATTPGDQSGVYSGAAAIFTPAGEIRLVSQKEGGDARSDDFISGSRLLEQHGPRILDEQSGTGLPLRELNGFDDIDIDYLRLPSDTGVAGINRVTGLLPPLNSSDINDPPMLLPPPFAVWFNQNGYLVSTGWDNIGGFPNDYQFVYYDGDYDDNIKLLGSGSRRGTVNNSLPGDPAGYDPNRCNPDSGDFDPNNWDNTKEKYILPFEMLESVVGVYVYSKEDFQDANGVWDREGYDIDYDEVATPPWSEMTTQANEDRWRWMRENGEMLMFSKQTGVIMRNRDQ